MSDLWVRLIAHSCDGHQPPPEALHECPGVIVGKVKSCVSPGKCNILKGSFILVLVSFCILFRILNTSANSVSQIYIRLENVRMATPETAP